MCTIYYNDRTTQYPVDIPHTIRSSLDHHYDNSQLHTYNIISLVILNRHC